MNDFGLTSTNEYTANEYTDSGTSTIIQSLYAHGKSESKSSERIAIWKSVWQNIEYQLDKDLDLQAVYKFSIIHLSPEEQTDLTEIGHRGRSSAIAEFCALVKKISAFAGRFFFGCGVFMTVFSLLGILVDKSTPAAILSVLTGMAIGCGLGMIGAAFKVHANLWEWCEKQCVDFYFKSAGENEKKHLESLKQWKRFDKLDQVQKTIDQMWKDIESISRVLGADFLEDKESFLSKLSVIDGKIKLFNQCLEALKNKKGGRELSSFLKA